MTSVQKINNTNHRPIINPKTTGYAAAGAMALTTIRRFSMAKPIVKSHKILGYITATLTLLHIGCVEYFHHKYKKK